MYKKVKKYTVFRSPYDGNIYITRNIPPIFTALYINDRLEIDYSSLIDKLDPLWLKKRMNGIDYSVKSFLKLEEKIRVREILKTDDNERDEKSQK